MRLPVNRKLTWYAICFGIPFTLAALLGSLLDQGIPSLYVALILLPLSSILFGCFLRFGTRSRPEQALRETPRCSQGQVFFICFALILLGWLPILLAYYPGLFNYDVANQILQITGQIPYNTHQPLVHTLLLGGFYRLGGLLGSYNTGILLYTIFQMGLLAGCFSWAVAYLYQRFSLGVLPLSLTVLFYALFPVNSILAISATKDVLFSGAVLAVLILWLRLFEGEFGWKLYLPLCVSTVCLLLLRNNALYALLPLLLFCPLLLRRGPARRRFFCCTLAAILGFLLCTKLLQSALSPQKGPMAEALSVPVQQIARIYNTCSLDAETEAEIHVYLPAEALTKYDSHLSDEVKRYLNVKNLPDLLGFLRLWLRLVPRYPAASVYAFLYQTEGLWYQADISNAKIYGFGLDNRQGYLLTDVKPGFGVTHTSLLPGLESLYERLFSANAYQQCPFLTCLFAPALYFWILFGCMLMFLYRKERTRLFCTGFLLLYYGTLLLGPCALIRYLYPIAVCCPLLLCAALSPVADSGR